MNHNTTNAASGLRTDGDKATNLKSDLHINIVKKFQNCEDISHVHGCKDHNDSNEPNESTPNEILIRKKDTSFSSLQATSWKMWKSIQPTIKTSTIKQTKDEYSRRAMKLMDIDELQLYVEHNGHVGRPSKVDDCVPKMVPVPLGNTFPMPTIVHQLQHNEMLHECTTQWRVNVFRRTRPIGLFTY